MARRLPLSMLAAGGRLYGTEPGGSIGRIPETAQRAARVQAPAGCQWHAAGAQTKAVIHAKRGSQCGEEEQGASGTLVRHPHWQ